MKDLLRKLKEGFTSSKAKTVYWQTGNGFIVLTIGILQGIKPDELEMIPVLIVAGALSLLNLITKGINKKYL